MIARSLKTRMHHLSRLLPAAALCLGALPANAANMVTNGDFATESTSPWWGNASMSETDPADYTLSVVDGRLCSTMTAGGKNPWDVILGYSGLALVAGKHYRVAFSVTADVERTIKFKTGLGAAPYSDFFVQKISVGPTPKSFDYTYLNLHEDPMGQFQYQIGTPSGGTSAAGRVCIDDVVIEEVPAPAVPVHVTPSMTGQPLKSHAQRLKIGTAVDTPIFLSSPLHNSIVAGEFSTITPANSMKMNLIQPTQGVFDFVDTDGLLAWAQANQLEFRGHPLVWHTQAPGWLTDGVFDRDQMIAIMYAHIDALLEHYAGKITYWDVVNEAIEWDGDAGVWGFRKTFWHDRIGPDFLELAFQHARAKDPAAKLFYNDYNVEQAGEGKADKVFELVTDLKSKGLLDGVGLQSHYFALPDGTTAMGIPSYEAIKANIARYGEIGVEVHITESDFRIGKPLDAAKQELQNEFYTKLLQICMDAPNCTHFTVWGLSDVDSWVPSTFPEYDYAHLFDASLMAKPAYQAMTQVLAKYNPDGTPVGSGASAPPPKEESSGCAVALAGTSSKSTYMVTLLGLLGLTLLSRRVSKRSRSA